MTFTWQFYTGGDTATAVKRCFRGPMIDVESVMSKSFQHMAAYEVLRSRLLKEIVSTEHKAVQTRETVLRVLDSNTSAIFLRLLPLRGPLHVVICEKRNSKIIDQALEAEKPFFANAARAFKQYGFPASEVSLLLDALSSNSPVLRVAGMSSVVLLAAYMEMDNLDGN